MKKALYPYILWATALLLIALTVFFVYVLFLDPDEHGIPAKTAHGNQQTGIANEISKLNQRIADFPQASLTMCCSGPEAADAAAIRDFQQTLDKELQPFSREDTIAILWELDIVQQADSGSMIREHLLQMLQQEAPIERLPDMLAMLDRQQRGEHYPGGVRDVRSPTLFLIGGTLDAATQHPPDAVPLGQQQTNQREVMAWLEQHSILPEDSNDSVFNEFAIRIYAEHVQVQDFRNTVNLLAKQWGGQNGEQGSRHFTLLKAALRRPDAGYFDAFANAPFTQQGRLAFIAALATLINQPHLLEWDADVVTLDTLPVALRNLMLAYLQAQQASVQGTPLTTDWELAMRHLQTSLGILK